MAKIEFYISYTLISIMWLVTVYEHHVKAFFSALMIILVLPVFLAIREYLIPYLRVKLGMDSWVIVYAVEKEYSIGLVCGSLEMMLKLAKEFPFAVGLYKSAGLLRRFVWFEDRQKTESVL